MLIQVIQNNSFNSENKARDRSFNDIKGGMDYNKLSEFVIDANKFRKRSILKIKVFHFNHLALYCEKSTRHNKYIKAIKAGAF